MAVTVAAQFDASPWLNGTSTVLPAAATTSAPTIVLAGPSPVHLQSLWDRSFTVLVVDLDAPYPERPHRSPLVHWISACHRLEPLMMHTAGTAGQLRGGINVLPWLPMAPPANSRPHRYVLSVFLEPPATHCLRQHWDAVPAPSRRSRFDIATYVTANGPLVPVASLTYLSQ